MKNKRNKNMNETNIESEEWLPMDQQIDKLWSKWDVKGGSENFRIKDMDAFLNSVETKNHEVEYEKLNNNLKLFDELVAWSMNLAMVVQSSLDDEHARLNFKQEQISSYASVCGAICSHLIAIRKLVLIGHDLPAKQILRSLSEHFDVLNLLWLNPKLASEFKNSESPEQANKFWHKHLSKGKLKRETEKLLFDNKVQESVDEWRQYRAEEEKVLGSAVHPTFTGCAMATLPPGTQKNLKSIGFMGTRAEVSIRTLSYAISVSWELMLNRTFPFGDIKKGKSTGNSLVQYNFSDENHLYVVCGRQVIIDIIMLKSEWQKQNPLLEPEYGNYPWPDDA